MMIDIKNRVLNFIKSLSYHHPNLNFTLSPFKIYEFKELMKNTQILKDDIILDIGCGDGLETILLGKKCKMIYGIDINKSRIDIAKRRSDVKKKKIKVYA